MKTKLLECNHYKEDLQPLPQVANTEKLKLSDMKIIVILLMKEALLLIKGYLIHKVKATQWQVLAQTIHL